MSINNILSYLLIFILTNIKKDFVEMLLLNKSTFLFCTTNFKRLEKLKYKNKQTF